jgi:peptidoglycan lytic transglycosylase A
MIAQDTGSAIVGPARADLYWGAGDAAGRIAGRIRYPGRFVMLLPRELDMIAAGKNMPLPARKPKIPDDEVKADEAKTGDIKTDDVKAEDKSKPEAAKPEPAKAENKAENGKKDDKPKSDAGKTEDAAKAPKKSQAGPARPKPGS